MDQRTWDDDGGDEAGKEDPLADPEGPQASDRAGSGEEDEYDVVACPHCGAEISELAEQCPYCGDWIVAGGGTGRRRWWTLAIAVILLILILLWLF